MGSLSLVLSPSAAEAGWYTQRDEIISYETCAGGCGYDWYYHYQTTFHEDITILNSSRYSLAVAAYRKPVSWDPTNEFHAHANVDGTASVSNSGHVFQGSSGEGSFGRAIYDIVYSGEVVHGQAVSTPIIWWHADGADENSEPSDYEGSSSYDWMSAPDSAIYPIIVEDHHWQVEVTCGGTGNTIVFETPSFGVSGSVWGFDSGPTQSRALVVTDDLCESGDAMVTDRIIEYSNDNNDYVPQQASFYEPARGFFPTQEVYDNEVYDMYETKRALEKAMTYTYEQGEGGYAWTDQDCGGDVAAAMAVHDSARVQQYRSWGREGGAYPNAMMFTDIQFVFDDAGLTFECTELWDFADFCPGYQLYYYCPADVMDRFMAAGSVDVDHEWVTVELPRVFEDPIVILGPPSYEGSHAVVTRVRNVTPNSFDIRLQEWDYLDGGHAYEEVSWMVVEAGKHIRHDGSVWKAGTMDTTSTNTGAVAFQTVNPGVDTRYMFTTVQTFHGEHAVTPRVKEASGTQFKVGLQEQESRNDGHGSETVGYLVIDNAGPEIEGYSVFVNREAVNDQWKSLSSPGVGWLMVQEEQSADSELGHATETISVLQLESLDDGSVLTFAQDVRFAGSDTASLRHTQ